MERFRTNRGTCSIADDELRLDESYRGQLRRYYEGAQASIPGFVLVAVGFIGFFWQFTYIALNGRWLLPYLFGAFVVIVILAYTIDHLRGFRRSETISLGAIAEVKVVNGSPLTHRRFIISYEDNGQPRKRRIKIPTRGFAFSKPEFERAKQLFRSNGISLTGDADQRSSSRQNLAEEL